MQSFDLIPAAARRCTRLGEEFLAHFLRLDTDRNPEHLENLAELAHVLTRLGRLEEGLEVDRKLARLEPENPIVHYNLACSLALLGRAGEALDALEEAVRRGFDDPTHLCTDEDLVSLRGEARFQTLLGELGLSSG